METGEWGRNADTDVYAPHMVLPLQPQHASQQSEATYDPIGLSITPAAGRTTWCDAATYGLCVLSVGFDRQTFSRVALLTHKLHVACRLFVHVGLD